MRWWTWLLQSDRHGLLPGSPFCTLPALHSALSCAPHTHVLSAPSPAALAFRTVTATVWMRCHSSWEELRGVHSGKPVTAGTQPGWEGIKSTSIPGAPFLPVQFKWFKHCFFHYWEKTVHATTNYSLNFAILTIFKKRIRHRHVLGLTCSEETQWRFERGRSRLGFRFSGLFGFFFFLFRLNGQVTDFTGEASVSFKNNSGKSTLKKVLQCWFLVPRLKKKFLNKFALFSGKQFRVMAFGLSEASLQDLSTSWNLDYPLLAKRASFA